MADQSFVDQFLDTAAQDDSFCAMLDSLESLNFDGQELKAKITDEVFSRLELQYSITDRPLASIIANRVADSLEVA